MASPRCEARGCLVGGYATRFCVLRNKASCSPFHALMFALSCAHVRPFMRSDDTERE